MSRIQWASYTAVLAAASFIPLSMTAQTRRQPLVKDRIDESVLHTLAGNTRPEANRQNDRGPVANSLPMEHMLLQLRRSPEQEDAARTLIDDLHNASSPKFHQWMTAEDFGKAFAPAPEDVEKVKAWLESHGFTVNLVYPSGMTIDFSGTASQVRDAFHTSVHYFAVNGQRHIANVSDPQIPAAFAPVVTGIVSMHDFLPHSMRAARRNYTYTAGGNSIPPVVPADLATIYNLNPLFKSGYTGKGQTIAVM